MPQVSERVYRIQAPYEGNAVHLYLVRGVKLALIDSGADHHSHALHRVVLDALEVPALVQGLRVAGRVDGPSAQLILPRLRRVPGECPSPPSECQHRVLEFGCRPGNTAI